MNTTNSCHLELSPNVDPNAPSLVCLNQDTGETIWTDNSPGENIARNQHCNPAIFRNGEKNFVTIGQGDGFVRAFDCETGAVAWKFELNSQQERSQMIARAAGCAVVFTVLIPLDVVTSVRKLLPMASLQRTRIRSSSGKLP